ncbi:tripartite tricarboxylate transporter TctB family protein [Sedimentitalea todarodis]|uniref:Tripartite tricarboxylate transporter TctB family protein n=2 Tax=Sedimentitalea todarodis TaxID=1631240 RepID=A0ABU3VG74_9RHOB|nr:tripartite tricarboxylate transporter TctB family protein [Sedimentitalea todarodis]
MRFNNAIPGTLLILFALAEIAYAATFPRLHGQNYGPDLFPTLIGIGLIVCGTILIFQGIAQRATVPLIQIGDWAQDRDNVLNVVMVLGCIVFYILLSDSLGFIPSSLLILTILLIRFGSSWRTSLIVAIATTFIIHTVFAKVLLVPLPWGILLPVAW